MREAYPHYQMSMTTIGEFVRFSGLAGYHFKRIAITGGEPLLWDNLEKAGALLRAAGLADTVTLWTNACDVARLRRVAPIFDAIQVSEYPGHAWRCDDLPKKARVRRVETHRVNPMVAVADSLPAECTCQGYYLFMGRVWPCGGMVHVSCRMGWSLDALSVPLGPDYLDTLDGNMVTRANPRWCERCGSNRRVDSAVPHKRIEAT